MLLVAKNKNKKIALNNLSNDALVESWDSDSYSRTLHSSFRRGEQSEGLKIIDSLLQSSSFYQFHESIEFFVTSQLCYCLG